MLTATQASDYLGLPLRAFERECPVQAVRIGRHVRWDRYALDAWVDSISKTEFEMTGEEWLAVFSAERKRKAGEKAACVSGQGTAIAKQRP